MPLHPFPAVAPPAPAVSSRAGGDLRMARDRVLPRSIIAQTAKTAQTPKSSMEWASNATVSVPAETAQTAETSASSHAAVVIASGTARNGRDLWTARGNRTNRGNCQRPGKPGFFALPPSRGANRGNRQNSLLGARHSSGAIMRCKHKRRRATSAAFTPPLVARSQQRLSTRRSRRATLGSLYVRCTALPGRETHEDREL
jgi:hypothetical protein